jgi:hypothetical protein
VVLDEKDPLLDDELLFDDVCRVELVLDEEMPLLGAERLLIDEESPLLDDERPLLNDDRPLVDDELIFDDV